MQPGSAASFQLWTESERVAALLDYDILDTLPEIEFDDIVDLAASILGAPMAAVNLIDSERQWFKSEVGLGVREMPRKVSICARILLQPGLTIVPDLSQDERFCDNPLIDTARGLRFYAGVPLVTPGGLPVGTLCVLDIVARPSGITDTQGNALLSLARLVVSQMERRRITAVSTAALAARRDGDARLATMFAERIASNQRLILSEEVARLAIEAADLGTWDIDIRTQVLITSNRARAMFGMAPEAVVTREDFHRCMHPDDRATSMDAFQTVIDPAVRAPYDTEYRVFGHSDGVLRWLAVKGRGIFDDDGVCIRAIGTILDITSRKQAEDRLRLSEAMLAESEAKFRGITDSIDQMVWSALPDGVIDFYNQRWYDYTGVVPGLPDGDAWIALFHPNDQSRARAVWHHSLTTGEPYRTESRLRHRSGQYRWVLGRAQPVRDDAGRIVRWYGTCTEIEELVQARQVLAQSRQQLELDITRRTAERDQLWDNARDLLLVLDEDGIFRAANPAWHTTLGWQPNEVVGGYLLDFIHPDDQAAANDAFPQARQGRMPLFETRFRHRDGRYRTISWVIAQGDGRIYASGRDVTEELASAKALAATQEQLRQAQKMEAVGQLTGGIAHDFNNMLAVVVGSLDMLGRRLAPDAARERRYVDAAMDGARRAAQLTQRLLAFSRQQPLQLRPLDVSTLVTGMSDLLYRALGIGVRLDTVLPHDLWLIHSDPNQLENVILNLALNARDAVEGGSKDGGRLTIEAQNASVDAQGAAAIQGMTPGDYVWISVTDTGNGMTADVMARAFDPFFTTKAVGRGTGLGLSQVYGFVRQSGGHLQMQSVVGHGTTVTVYLPRLVSAETGWKAAAPDAAAPTGLAQELILVVEDEPTVRAFSVEALTQMGYQVLDVDNAATALGILDAVPEVALLFTDVVMPDMNGRRLADEARRRRPDLRVLFTTGYTPDAVADHGVLGTGVHVIGKPFTFAELASKVRIVLDAPAFDSLVGAGVAPPGLNLRP